MYRWFLLSVMLMAALAVCSSAPEEKRAEMAPVPFVLGSRYGRSPPRMLAPRNDRFFMGSRYGKRSGVEALPASSVSPLVCEFTGVFPLYRCLRPAQRLAFDNRRNEEDSVFDADE